jgi:aminomethyltransferase
MEKLCVGDIKELKVGSAALSLFTNEQGGIEDDTIITNMTDYLYI